MKLKINSSTQAKPFAGQIDFLPDNIVLHADTDIVLTYSDTCLEIILWLENHVSFHKQEISYRPFIQRFIFKFITPQFTYQVEHAGTIQQFFALLEEKHPFQKTTISFENHTLDLPRKQFAENIAHAIEKYNQSGIVPKIRNISISQATFPIKGTFWTETFSPTSKENDKTAKPEKPETHPLYNIFVGFWGILIASGLLFYLHGTQEPLSENWYIWLICVGAGFGGLYVCISNAVKLYASPPKNSNKNIAD